MSGEIIYNAAFSGAKAFRQQQVYMADATGFGAAEGDYAENDIDLNELLIRNKPATFFLRVSGDAMTGAGIFAGDVVIVDRSITPQSGQVIIAALDGELLIRRFEKSFNKIRLIPETKNLGTVDVDPFADFSVWGVVTCVIRRL